MANGKVRVGIVGAGFAARIHLDCYRKVHGISVEISGLTSLRKERRESLASDYGISACDSLRELAARSDLIDICVPGYAHERTAIEALEAGCHVAIEKPMTGYYGDGTEGFRGDSAPKGRMMKEALASADRIFEAAKRAKRRVMYAENWIYSPSIQKEVEILRSAKSQILWMVGEESHSGSHSESYGVWSLSGGGALVGKACHPLTAAIYLKFTEGLLREGRPIRTEVVSANVSAITRLPSFRDEGYLRTSYRDVEDYSQLHLTFSDGTVADILASDLVMGGLDSWLDVRANNHRTRCRISPVDIVTTYNPKEELLNDVYVVEKIGTKQGWNNPAPDEWWTEGYYQEIQDFVECAYHDRDPISGGELARECVSVMYTAYLSAERGGESVSLAR
jgi:predicted dehydrogenase